MLKNKAFLILKSLSVDEMLEFENHLKTQKIQGFLLKTFQFFKKYYPFFDTKNISKQFLHKKLYQNQSYNDVNIRFHLSQLAKELERFILHTSKTTHFDQNIHHLKYYKEKSIPKLFEEKLKKSYTELKKNSKRDQEFFFNSFQLENEHQQYLAQNAQTSKRYRENITLLKIQALDKFYILSKLKQICSAINYQKTFQQEADILFKKEIIGLIQTETDLIEEPAINIYYYVYLSLIEEKNTKHFQNLRKAISKNSQVFGNREARDLYIFAQNYCIRKVNNGNANYLHKLFDLYQESTQKGVIYQNGNLSPWDYKNIISLGLRLNKLDWTKRFIEVEKEKIHAQEQQNAYTYNLANFYFFAKEYNQAIQLLLSVEYNDVFYQLGSKTILLKSYYELDEFDAMYSLLDSFKMLIQRKRDISKNNKTLYLNFIKFVKQLIGQSWNNQRKLKLKKLITETQLIADRKWLNEKLEER